MGSRPRFMILQFIFGVITRRVLLALFLLWFQYQRSVFELLLSLPTPKAESTSRNGVCRRLLLYKILTPTLSNARKSDNLQIASSFLPSKRNDSSDRTTFSFCVRHLKLPIISLPLSVSSVHLYKVTIAPKGWSCYNHWLMLSPTLSLSANWNCC